MPSSSNGGGTNAYDSLYSDGTTVSDVYTRYSSYCKLTVTVVSGVTITNNGKLFIGGTQSGGGGGYVSGHIGQKSGVGGFAKMILKGTASLISNGVFVNYGYLFGDNSTGTVSLLGTTYVPFVLIEHRGGSNFCVLKMTDNLKGSPFNRFFFPSFVDITTNFTGNSILYAIPDLYANSQHNRDRTTMIGSGGFIQPGNNFSLTVNFTFETYSGSTKMPKHTMDFYGNFTLNSLSISVDAGITTVQMSTSDVYFPVSCYYDISLHVSSGQSSASVSLGSQKVKILPGASLIIDNGVSVTSQGMCVYSKDTASDLKGAAGAVNYEKANVDGILIVNGVLNSTVLAGYIDTNSTTGKVTCTTTSATMYEVSSTETGTYSIIIKEITGAIYYSVGVSATCPISNANGDRVVGDLPTGTTNASSLGDRWDIVLGTNLESVTFVSTSGSYASDAGAEATYTLTASISPPEPEDFDSSYGYHWSSSDTTNGKFGGSSGTSTATGRSVTFYTTANSGSSDATVTVTVTVKNTSGNSFTYSKVFTRAKKASSCLLPETLITMKDGSKKMVKDIEQGDLVLVMNHETGQLDVAPITFNDYDAPQMMTVLNAIFSDNTSVSIVSEHGFFDVDTMRYEYISEETYQELIGDRFIKQDGTIVTLENVTIEERLTDVYSPTSFYHLNYFTEDMLSMPGGITGLFNIFEYGDNLQYDQEKYAEDIATYGLFTYEELAPLGVSEIMFEAYAGQYLKVAIGKGILTQEYLEYLIERYAHFTD